MINITLTNAFRDQEDDWSGEGTVNPPLPYRIMIFTRNPRLIAQFPPGTEEVGLTLALGGILSQRATYGKFKIPFNISPLKGFGLVEIYAVILFGINGIRLIILARSNTITITV